MRQISIFVLLLAAYASFAQDANLAMSNPIKFRETGWNKVLCMKNGNTLLFHFEPERSIGVYVFDSAHRLISTEQVSCRIIDLDRLKTAIFKGLFEINGEAVLFLNQEIVNKQCLIRARFDGRNGKLTDESIVGKSDGIAKNTWFYVMKYPGADSYAILFDHDEPQYYKCNIHVSCYDNKHQMTSDVPLDVERAKYDYLLVTGADMAGNGIMVTLNLMKMVSNEVGSGDMAQRAVYDHKLALYYIPNGSKTAEQRIVDVKDDFTPYYAFYTPNVFANTVNLLVYSFRKIFYKFGIDVRKGYVSGNLFFKMETDNSDLKYNWLNYDAVTDSMHNHSNDTNAFAGIPLAMFTNENGLTTVITEGFQMYDEPESKARYSFEGYYGDIGVTQLDDDGKELWGTILPHSERYNSYVHYYEPVEVAKKYQTHAMFDDWPDQIATRQFLSANTYQYNKSVYVLFNDNKDHMNMNTGVAADTVYSFEKTSICLYKINSKRQISKRYLFAPPGTNEFACGFTEGADFDPKRGTYATLIQYTKNNTSTIRMAWHNLD